MDCAFRKMIVVFLISTFLISCDRPPRKIIDISETPPYSMAIGKKFILLKNLFIYRLPEESIIMAAEPGHVGQLGVGLPNTFNEKYVGFSSPYASIIGTLKKGEIIIIRRVVLVKTPDVENIYYRAISAEKKSLDSNEFDINYIIDRRNPPKTAHWSDPPIFQSDIAIPFEADGVWWKYE